MGKGSSPKQPTQTSQNITQTDLPAYAKPYYQDLMKRAQGESNRQYEGYQGQRIAEFNPTQQWAQNQATGLQRPIELDDASYMATQAGLGALDASYGPGQYSDSQGNYRASQFQGNQGAYNPNNYDNSQFNTDSWTSGNTAQNFMSPYMQNAVDVQKDEAIRDAQKGMLAQNLGAARSGTYGGSRQLLAATERERNLGDELSQIQMQGTQAAYDRGQSAFEQEQARRLQTQGMGEDSKQFGAQFGEQSNQFGAGFNQANDQFRNQFNEQSKQFGYNANQQNDQFRNQFNEQSKQFGAQFGLSARDQALQAAQGLGNLGNMIQGSDLSRISAQATAGAEQQDLDQRKMDMAYGDFLRQRDYPKEQLNFYNAQLRGVPMTLSSTDTAYAPTPSRLSQIGGAGLSALGMYQNSGR